MLAKARPGAGLAVSTRLGKAKLQFFTSNGPLTLLSLQVLNLEVMDRSRHWKIVGCSAYTGEGLLDGFDWLVQDIASRIYVLD